MTVGSGPLELGDNVGWIVLPDAGLSAALTEYDGPVTIEMATQDDFHLLRIIGTLKILGGDKELFAFDEPARLQLRFTGADLNRALRRGKQLMLAYWWQDQWVPFEPTSVPANRKAVGENWAYFEFFELPDPVIAWGT